MKQVILNMLVTKDIYKKVFEYIYTWGETLTYIQWDKMASYHQTIGTTPGQAIFGRDTILKLTSFLDWKFITAKKK